MKELSCLKNNNNFIIDPDHTYQLSQLLGNLETIKLTNF